MDDPVSFGPDELKAQIDHINAEQQLEKSPENMKLIFSVIDLTSLNTEDTAERIKTMCLKINRFSGHFPDIPNVGAICVYPSLVPVVKEHLNVTGVKIASVAAGFPSSQTFLPVKEMECRMAAEAGASEIDIVMSVGNFIGAELDPVCSEISRIKEVIGPAKLKVILETGLLREPENIYNASMACLRAGADFIKTSTGKITPAATPEAVLVMCHAIKDFYTETGKKSGIKPAGGIGTAGQALGYASIVQAVLGKDWLDPSLFRIGASRLANQVLSEISLIETGGTGTPDYF